MKIQFQDFIVTISQEENSFHSVLSETENTPAQLLAAQSKLTFCKMKNIYFTKKIFAGVLQLYLSLCGWFRDKGSFEC